MLITILGISHVHVLGQEVIGNMIVTGAVTGIELREGYVQDQGIDIILKGVVDKNIVGLLLFMIVMIRIEIIEEIEVEALTEITGIEGDLIIMIDTEIIEIKLMKIHDLYQVKRHF